MAKPQRDRVPPNKKQHKNTIVHIRRGSPLRSAQARATFECDSDHEEGDHSVDYGNINQFLTGRKRTGGVRTDG
jgi:hypothetical protein